MKRKLKKILIAAYKALALIAIIGALISIVLITLGNEVEINPKSWDNVNCTSLMNTM